MIGTFCLIQNRGQDTKNIKEELTFNDVYKINK